MQQINSVVAQVQVQASLSSPKLSEDKRSEPLSASTVKMVLGLFTRIAELFLNKASVHGLIVYFDEEKGIYSDAFKLWCVKLKDLTIEDFATGTLNMERKAEALYKANEEMWPPSFAEFRALCFPIVSFDKQAHRILPCYSDPKNAHLIEDLSAKEKRYELGRKKSGELRKLLGDEPKVEREDNAAFAKAQLEKANLILNLKINRSGNE